MTDQTAPTSAFPVIAETIIVEGRDDTNSIKRAVTAETIETHGFGIRRQTWELIDMAYRTTGIIVFTDPDHAGETIRKRILDKYPDALEAFLDQESARAGDDIGIENAAPEAIREALAKVHRAVDSANGSAGESVGGQTGIGGTAGDGTQVGAAERFSMDDLREAGLIGTDRAQQARQAAGKALGIGYGNAKAFLRKLNHYGITREDFENAVRAWQESE